jgi:hypothetical protein
MEGYIQGGENGDKDGNYNIKFSTFPTEYSGEISKDSA